MALSPPRFPQSPGGCSPTTELPLPLRFAVLVAALLCAALPIRATPNPASRCRNECDFYFDGFAGVNSGAVPAFKLTPALTGAAVISPRILYGKGRAVQVHASGPAEPLGRLHLKSAVETVRRLTQKREEALPYMDKDALGDSRGQLTFQARERAGTSPLTLWTGARSQAKKTVGYAFFAASRTEASPAFLYQEPLTTVDSWQAARGRCFKLPLIKFRVYYWRAKFVYITEGDGNTFFPESRRCVVFRTR